ncbi:MAG TPA: Tad domain-containing protein [Gaiellaceae bacterium]|nr:Tad domain-containing protein [Gaiellaceae bacterium]
MVGLRKSAGDVARGSRGRLHERGQVTVLLALLLPMILALSAIVVDVGNWYVHKKRLQTLVDAGAFAGATKFVGCSFQFGDPVAANAAIKSVALAYSGDTIRDPATINLQVQEPNDVRIVLNSAQYWTDGYPTDGVGLDDTLDQDGDPLTAGDPCSSKTLDVKATDDDAPLLFGFIPLVIDPKSKARVEIRQIKEQSGMLPWAVPEIDPAAVAAIFVNESTGAVLDWQLLMRDENYDPNNDFDNDPTTNRFPSTLAAWITPEARDCPEPSWGCVPIPFENTGIVILVSKADDDPSLFTGGAGTLTTICSQDPDLVACYAGDGNQDGLSFVHGWSDAPGAPNAPQIRDVSVTNATCADDLSAPYFLLTGDCDVGATAVIDFGVEGDPTLPPPSGINAVVKLEGPGCGNSGCPMTYSGAATSPTESIWITAAGGYLAPASGRSTFSIAWATELDDASTHSGTFPSVANPYVADDASGPILFLKLHTEDTNVLDPNSRSSGPERSVVVAVGLNKPLQIRDPFSEPVLLRYASPSGSLNQALDCDSGVTFTNEIINGCQTTYGLNFDDFDKDGNKEWADITCSAYPSPSDLPPPSFANDPAPNCIAAKTGDVIAFTKGLRDRFEEPTCAPNNWPEDQGSPGRGPEDVAALREFFTNYDFANDPRYVTLIITDITAFEGTGSTNLPVKYFAGFYATGWDISPHTMGCPGENDPHPLLGTGYKKSKDNGDVWGHFVNIVVFSSSGLPNDQLCNFDELGNCIAVLVE